MAVVIYAYANKRCVMGWENGGLRGGVRDNKSHKLQIIKENVLPLDVVPCFGTQTNCYQLSSNKIPLYCRDVSASMWINDVLWWEQNPSN